jgi:hypothetical protein
LAIALWVSNGGIADFFDKIFTVPLEYAAGELGPIVSDDPIRYPKPTNDGLDKVDYFWPFGEFIDGDIEIPVPSDGPEKWPQNVQPPNSE